MQPAAPSRIVGARPRSIVALALLGVGAATVAIAGVVVAFVVSGGGTPPEPKRIGRALPATDPSLSPPAPPSPSARAHKRRHRAKNVQEPRPVRIRIPAIGVNARVVRLGLAPDKSMQTPASYADTGWFAPGPEPGERGAAVIAGHVDSTAGPAVFFRLGELHRGNLIRIRVATGRTITFQVRGVERWPKAKFPTRRVFGATRAPTLRLITCGGAFDRASGHYVDNTIVYAVRRTAGRT